ncbi:MAG: hypothetical protein P8130_07750 [Deltaproteobacteria bacterium]
MDNESSTDWEEAFQAEDFLIQPEELSQTLPGDPVDGRLRKERAETRQPRAVRKDARRRVAPGKGLAVMERIGLFFEILGENRFVCFLVDRLPMFLRQGPLFRSAKSRGAIFVLAIILCCSVLLVTGNIRQKTVGRDGSLASLGKGGTAIKKKAAASLPPASKPFPTGPAPPAAALTRPEDAASQPQVTASAIGKKRPADSGVIRRNWRFSSFIINASQNAAEAPSYVEVDLSLVLKLHAGKPFPEEKEYAVREMIYQFFNNRPLYELRRFSMARGEMKLKLQAWFSKEWPNNPIESISFHRYQII